MKMAWVRLLDYLWRGQDGGSGIVVSIFPLLDLLEAFNSTVSFWTDSEDWRCRAQYCPSSSPLQGWFQSVMIGEESSCPLSYYLRCPQGLVFSPVLFNIYMRALGEFIHCHGVKHPQYANATHLYIYAPGELSDAVDILYCYLEAVSIWMGNNRLQPNPGTSECLWVLSRSGSGTLL